MKIRLLDPGEGKLTVAVADERGWLPLQPALARWSGAALPELEAASASVLAFLQGGERVRDQAQQLLDAADPEDFIADPAPLPPLQPRSFRDFMLYEQHYIDAARGMVRRFMPEKMTLLQLYERIFKKPHPKLRPKPIWYEKPIYYMGSHINFYTDGDLIPWPDYTQALDYELELGVIIAQPLYNATPEEALQAIGGFVVINDFSARDVQYPEMQSGFGPVKSKNFANAMSAVVVTADEILGREEHLTARVTVNGQRWGEGVTRGMQFSLAEMVAYASLGERVLPGEVMATGTIPGCSGMETGQWLSHGDEIVLEIEGIGILRNRIA